MKITKEEIEQFKKDCKARGLKLPQNCTDEWCIKQLKNLYEDITALEEIKDNCVEMLATIAEEGNPNKSIVDTIWCKNIPCCTLFELIENTQNKINEVLK